MQVVTKPADAQLKVPPGFEIKQFAGGLNKPRLMRTAPNGDIFVAESNARSIRVLRPSTDGAMARAERDFRQRARASVWHRVLSDNADPRWVYVANSGSVLRFDYHMAT